MPDAIKTVIDTVNIIGASLLNHRKFRNNSVALDEAEFGGGEVFNNSVRWPSRGAVLERVATLIPHVISFLK